MVYVDTSLPKNLNYIVSQSPYFFHIKNGKKHSHQVKSVEDQHKTIRFPG